VGSNPTPRTLQQTHRCFEVILWLRRNGHKRGAYSESTLEKMLRRLKWLAKKVDLSNPGKVKQYILSQKWSNGFKNNLVKVYNHYARYHSFQPLDIWFAEIHKIPKVPTTEQINKIIAHAKPKYALILALMKETGMRPIEISKLTLKSFDLKKRTVIASGAKLGKQRELSISQNTVAMLKNHLSKHDFSLTEKLFPKSRSIRDNYLKIRRNLAKKLGDPILMQVKLYDFRHYFASMLYHKTKDILYVKEQLGHRRLENTLVYTHLIDFKEEEYVVRVAKTVKVACQLVEAGFDYVTEIDGVKLFRKRK